MKKSVRVAFAIYHLLFPSKLATCRYFPTCSEFFQTAVEKKGFTKGSIIGIKRLLSCHPFSKKAYIDPVI